MDYPFGAMICVAGVMAGFCVLVARCAPSPPPPGVDDGMLRHHPDVPGTDDGCIGDRPAIR